MRLSTECFGHTKRNEETSSEAMFRVDDRAEDDECWINIASLMHEHTADLPTGS